jgi:hypothetical protein
MRRCSLETQKRIGGRSEGVTRQESEVLAQLGRVPIEGKNLGSARLAQKNWRIVRRKARPTSPINRRLLELSQAGHLLQLMVADPNSEYSGCRRTLGLGKKIDVVGVARPFGVAGMDSC